MNTIIAAVAATLFSASASAANIYSGLDEGNSDLNASTFSSDDFAGVQPGVGNSFDRYHGFTDGNSDFFQHVEPESGVARSSSSDDSPVYVGPGRTLSEQSI